MTAGPGRGSSDELSLAELTCLALVAEGISHGWAIGRVLAPDGELGRIWSLSRPLTYRAIDQLDKRDMITRTGTAPGRGRDRRTIAVTPKGKRAAKRWLGEPVEHLRDMRTELLVKLELRRRAGLPAEPLITAQADALGPTIDALTDVRDPDFVALWRREQARAARRFLTAARASADADDDRSPPGGADADGRLGVSARNQLHATITSVTVGDVLCSVTASLPDGQTMTATITRHALDDLDLAEGDPVIMIAKATETMIARPP